MRHWTVAALLGLAPLAWSQEPQTFEAMAEAQSQSEACQLAFAETETDARNAFGLELDELELLARTDERLGQNDADRFECHVTTRWAQIGAAAEGPILSDSDELIGSEQRITGAYQATCSTERLCRERIERDAAADLLEQLVDDYGIRRRDVHLEPDGFEGTQRSSQRNRETQLSMDGTFYFRVREPLATRPETLPPRSTEAEVRIERRPERKDRSLIEDFDLTLSYTWDTNNRAEPGQLALSAERWNMGIWANNRVGASLMWGSERAGIADNKDRVFNDGDRYAIRGIGFGFRMFDNRSVTVENMLHYVDTRTYRTTLDPGCSGCTPREYESEDYLQATVNLKTNTKGLNLGWMLTWKLRPDLSNYDSLSGGWYIELQL